MPGHSHSRKSRGRSAGVVLAATLIAFGLMVPFSTESNASPGAAVVQQPGWQFDASSEPFRATISGTPVAHAWTTVPGGVLWTQWVVCSADSSGSWEGAYYASSGGGGNYAESDHHIFSGCAPGEVVLAIGMSKGSNTYFQGQTRPAYPGPGHIAVEWDFVPDLVFSPHLTYQIVSWEIAPDGTLTYEIRLLGTNLSAPIGPCETSCAYALTFYYELNGVTYSVSLSSQSLATGTGALDTTVTGSVALPAGATAGELTATLTGQGPALSTTHNVSSSVQYGTDLAAAAVAVQQATAAGQDPCSNLLFVNGTRVQNTSTTDQYNDCEATAGLGSWLARLAYLVKKYGPAIALVLTASSDSPAPPTDPAPSPDPEQLTVTPTSSAVELLAEALIAHSAGKVTDPNVASDLAEECLRQTALAGLFDPADHCSNDPVFFPGGDAPATTANDYDGIFVGDNTTDGSAHYEHIRLTYRQSGRLSGTWKNTMPQCAGSSTSFPCDEYPFLSTYQAGGDEAALTLVPQLDNSREGGYLSGFYARCGVSVQDETAFLVIPMIGESAPATTSSCGSG